MLAQRLGENPNDTDALNTAYAHGQKDPRSYAIFLEKAGAISLDPATGAHWYCEAATVWTASLADELRAERALMHAMDKDPFHIGAAGRLVEAYRQKGNLKGLVGLYQRRAKNAEKFVAEQPELAPNLGEIYSELARLFTDELGQPERAIDAYKRAALNNPGDAYAIYQARELLKGAGRLREALPFYAAEQALIQADSSRRLALYIDEADVCRRLGDSGALLAALRGARSVDASDDANIKQQLGSAILQQKQAGEPVAPEDLLEAAGLFVSLAESYDGEHGFSYSVCALQLQPENDRAAQLAMYYGDQIGRSLEAAGVIAGYLTANPTGAVASDARTLVALALSETGDDSLIAALTPPESADSETKVAALSTIARSLVAQGRQREATRYYTQIVELSPADEEGVAFVADTLRGKKERELCELLVRAASVESTPLEQRKVWFSEVAVLCEGPLQDVDGAIDARRHLVMLDPSDEDAADHLEGILEKAEKWQQLAELLARRADVDPDEESRLARELRVADVYLERLGDRAGAAEALARAVHIDPDDETRAFQAVSFFIESDRAHSARLLLEELLGRDLTPDARASYSERLGELLLEADHPAEAGGAFAEAATLTDSQELWQKAEDCFARGQNWEQAARSVAERRALAKSGQEKSLLCAREADFLEQLGDVEGALAILREALELDPKNLIISDRLEKSYLELARSADLVAVLLTRAEHLEHHEDRVDTRKRAAFLQRDHLDDRDAMRQTLLLVLEDAEDAEALDVLADLSEQESNTKETIEYLRRLEKCVTGEARVPVALRLGRLLEEEGDEQGALEHLEVALAEQPNDLLILSAVADLQRRVGKGEAAADSYTQLLELAEGGQKLATARCLADLLSELERPEEAIATYKIVLALDSEDFDAVANLRDLAEKAGKWEDFVEYHAQLMELEGDDEEAAAMAMRLAEVLVAELDQSEKALAVLAPFAEAGDAHCLEEYEQLGDRLGKQEVVAESLLTWMEEAPAGESRNAALRRAYDRFLQVENRKRAIFVGLELLRVKAADEAFAKSLEDTATLEKDTDALQAAFDVLGRELSGPARAEEMVRQAEVLAGAGMAPEEAILHGEQALTSVSPEEAEPLLARLGVLSADAEGAIGVYERQVSRCKSPAERLAALCRAAEVAAEHGNLERVKQFFEIALQAAGPAEGLDELRARAKQGDARMGESTLRETLCQVLAASGKGARDGGKIRAGYLARAADIAYRDLNRPEEAFERLCEALISHADEEKLDQLQAMGEAEKDLVRVAHVLGRALEQVHDGPLVRMLLRRRFELRTGQLDDKAGASEDLKRLYDLSPADAHIAEQLENRYQAANDHLGLVHLYEDQILRGRDQKHRAELARKVALLWQDVLSEPREAADAWRRVLRMNTGDTEAKAGLSRAKQAMRKVSVKEVAADEAETRKEVEARRASEEAEVAARQAELERKAAELKARHSQPPPRVEEIMDVDPSTLMVDDALEGRATRSRTGERITEVPPLPPEAIPPELRGSWDPADTVDESELWAGMLAGEGAEDGIESARPSEDLRGDESSSDVPSLSDEESAAGPGGEPAESSTAAFAASESEPSAHGDEDEEQLNEVRLDVSDSDVDPNESSPEQTFAVANESNAPGESSAGDSLTEYNHPEGAESDTDDPVAEESPSDDAERKTGLSQGDEAEAGHAQSHSEISDSESERSVWRTEGAETQPGESEVGESEAGRAESNTDQAGTVQESGSEFREDTEDTEDIVDGAREPAAPPVSDEAEYGEVLPVDAANSPPAEDREDNDLTELAEIEEMLEDPLEMEGVEDVEEEGDDETFRAAPPPAPSMLTSRPPPLPAAATSRPPPLPTSAVSIGGLPPLPPPSFAHNRPTPPPPPPPTPGRASGPPPTPGPGSSPEGGGKRPPPPPPPPTKK